MQPTLNTPTAVAATSARFVPSPRVVSVLLLVSFAFADAAVVALCAGLISGSVIVAGGLTIGKHYFPAFAIMAVSVLGALAPDVKADEWNRKTNITVNEPVEIRCALLPAGSYVQELANLSSNRNVAQILSAETTG